MRLRRWTPLFAVNAAVIVFLLALGHWQLARLAWKEGLIRQLENAISANTPAVSLSEAEEKLANDPSGDYVRVNARGTFVNQQERYLFAARNGEPGWHLIVPFNTQDDNRLLLVDRGFVPHTKKEPASRPGSLVTGVVELQGFARKNRPKGFFTPGNDASRNIWYWPDPVELFASLPSLGQSVPFGYVVEALPSAGQYPWPKAELPDPRALPNNHLQYAITWFGLAAVWAVMTVVLFVSRRKSTTKAGLP